MAKSKNNSIESGQSTIEYILLLVVVVSFSYALYNNPRFKSFFGKNGFFLSMKTGIGHSYRYGYDAAIDPAAYNYENNKHNGYYNEANNTSRFFSPLGEYGN